jgi:prepilin-type N-terminal cleavage/methylation domain-containing protein
MLKKLMALSRAELKSRLDEIDVSAVRGRSLKRRFEAIRGKKQGGFTLLELLVVVAILAAIAGTATIMLQDTDRKGMAAAHVAMMDELSKGIATYRVLNGGAYPDVWDSLIQDSAASTTGGTLADGKPLSILNADLQDTLAFAIAEGARKLDATDVAKFQNSGIRRVRVVGAVASHKGADWTLDCGSIEALVLDKGHDVTPQNIFQPVAANGCGYAVHHELAANDVVATWAGAPERIGLPSTAIVGDVVAFGVGPDSTLFNASNIGALSTVPVYRHNASGEYNRFIVLWNLNPTVDEFTEDKNGDGTADDSGYISKSVGGGQVAFQAIIDGAGDTKDEELGEVDNVRSTL